MKENNIHCELIHVKDWKIEEPLISLPAIKYMNPKLLPVPFFVSDNLYTGIEKPFFNKQNRTRMSSRYFKNMILNRISLDEKRQLLEHLKSRKKNDKNYDNISSTS